MKSVKLAVAAAVCAALPLGVEVAAAGQGPGAHPVQTERMTPAALTQEMRKLWTDHVIWTRDYIVAAIADQPGAPASAGRLLKNQEDIGRAVALFYGEAAGQKLAALLKEHITVAVDVVKAAKSGDKAAYQRAEAAWQRNGADIAAFLSAANPNWPQPALAAMMKEHLATTTAMVVARLSGKWDEDVRAFDTVYAHILHMADALAGGIVKQFPERFGPVAATSMR
jgi:hypothetical protein